MNPQLSAWYVYESYKRTLTYYRRCCYSETSYQIKLISPLLDVQIINLQLNSGDIHENGDFWPEIKSSPLLHIHEQKDFYMKPKSVQLA